MEGLVWGGLGFFNRMVKIFFFRGCGKWVGGGGRGMRFIVRVVIIRLYVVLWLKLFWILGIWRFWIW